MTSAENFDTKPPPMNGLVYDIDTLKDAAPSDEKYYDLDEAEFAFFSSQTKIQDPKDLKKHILAIQKAACEVHPYPCLRLLRFLRLKISRLPAYPAALKLGRERPGALFLDIGCCVGNDVRKIVADGFPAGQAFALDLRPEFWEIGHKLFNSTPETFPVKFIPGDVFDSAIIAPAPIVNNPLTDRLPDLVSLTSLTPLLGRLSVIHASWFFHLFGEEKQLELARKVASLLSPEPGSMILGTHVSRPEKGLRVEALRPGTGGHSMFCHSPASWKELWEKSVFSDGQVIVNATLVEVQRDDSIIAGADIKAYVMPWSVTKL